MVNKEHNATKPSVEARDSRGALILHGDGRTEPIRTIDTTTTPNPYYIEHDRTKEEALLKRIRILENRNRLRRINRKKTHKQKVSRRKNR